MFVTHRSTSIKLIILPPLWQQQNDNAVDVSLLTDNSTLNKAFPTENLELKLRLLQRGIL